MIKTDDMPPNVYFVIPAYNSERYILRSINSALDQIKITSKVIVINHGSTDNTENILIKYFHDDKRVNIINLPKTPNEISSATRPLNRGIKAILEKSTPENWTWMIRLDADDFLAEKDIISEALRNGKYLKLICGMLTFFDEITFEAFKYGPKNKYKSKGGILKMGAYAMAHHATLHRLDFLKNLSDLPNLYDEEISYGEDLDLTLRLFGAVNKDDLIFIDNSILFKSLNQHSITSNAKKMRIWSDINYVFKKNKSLSKILLLRLALDLLLRNNPKLHILRRFFGLPAHRVGTIVPVSPKQIKNRIKSLDNIIQRD